MLQNKEIKVNLFSIVCFFVFFLLSIAYRILLPFGDEPDFTVRAPRFVLNGSEYIPNIVNYLATYLEYESQCKVKADFLSYLGNLDFDTCVQDPTQIFMRLMLQYLLILIPFLLLCYRAPVYLLFRKDARRVLDAKLDSLSLFYIFPSFFFYFGVVGWEQFMLIISSLLILLLASYFFLFLLIFWLVLLDVGDSLVVIYASIMFFFYRFLFLRFGLRVVFSFSVLLILLAYVFGIVLIDFVVYFEIFREKALSISSSYENSQIKDKYPLVLRPAITFMSLVMSLPSGVRSNSAIALSFILCILLLLKVLFKKRMFDINAFVYLFVFVTVVLTIVFILPGYANGKYYVFMLPMLFYFFLNYVDKFRILLFVLIVNSLCLIELSLYYIN